MTKIIRYIHRPNKTELGLGNTHDRYLVAPDSVLEPIFPNGIEILLYDINSHKNYSVYSKRENNEYRIKKMGEIYEDYQTEPGDEIEITRFETSEGVRTTLNVKECGMIFLNPGRIVNKVIQDFEIYNIKKIQGLSKEKPYKCEYEYLKTKHSIEIEFLESRSKREDSPKETDFYVIKYDGKLLSSLKNSYYYLFIKKDNVILKNLPKYEFQVLFMDNNSKKTMGAGRKSLQQIFYGAPGTGKSHTIKKKEEAGLRCIRTTFHPDSDYATFVGCYKPHRNHDTGKLTYEFVEQAFLEAYKLAWQNPQQEIALVIEEINRGNCAQIFGDIFQLLDRDEDGWSTYPIKADTDISDHLEDLNIDGYSEKMEERYGKDKSGFGFMALPPNMSLLATMNTSDQSLFPIDSAFKRRWDWEYIPISKGKDENGNDLNWTIETTATQKDWWKFLNGINTIIESTTHSEDKELGFFFCKAENNIISKEKFVNKVVFYLWNDVFKTYGFRSDIFDKDEEGKEKLSFKDFFCKEGTINEEMVALFVSNVMKHSPKDENGEIDAASTSSSSSLMVTYNGQNIEGESAKAKYKEIVKRVIEDRGAKLVAECLGSEITQTIPEDTTRNYQIIDGTDWYLATNNGIAAMKQLIVKLKTSLSLDINIE